MKRLLAAMALVALPLAGVSAADLSLPLKSPAGPAFNWSGFYVGGNAGGAWGNELDRILDNQARINSGIDPERGSTMEEEGSPDDKDQAEHHHGDVGHGATNRQMGRRDESENEGG